MKTRTRSDSRRRRHMRLRKKVCGTAERPRMAVSVSGRYIQVQFIDDGAGKTLTAVSSIGKDATGSASGNTREAARQLGEKAAMAAKEKGIEAVVFDRGGVRYGARLKALADAAREKGLTF